LRCSARVGTAVEEQILKRIESELRDAAAIGQLLLRRDMPCFSQTAASDFLSHYPFGTWRARPPGRENELIMEVSIQGDAVFGFWCLWAVVAEGAGEQRELVSLLRETKGWVTKVISDIIEARMLKTAPEKVLQDFAGFKLPQGALEFVGRWITGEISFVAPPKPARETNRREPQLDPT